jgi:uncharacterized protein (TIGR03643 family)
MKNETASQIINAEIPLLQPRTLTGDNRSGNNYVLNSFTENEKDRIIEMAWEDRTPFEAIAFQFGLQEKDVIEFMRQHSKRSSFKMWRKRMASRKTKHLLLRDKTVNRFKCSRQKISGNKISKR